MELAFLVYLIGVLGPLTLLLALLAIVLAMATGIAAIAAADINKTPKMWRWALPLVVSMLFVSTLLPTEKTAYLMVGAYAAQKVAEDPKLQELSRKVLAVVETKIDSYAQEAQELQAKKPK